MPKIKKEGEKFESTARLTGSLQIATYEDLEKLGISKASLISEANSLIPDDFDVEKNEDVLPIIFNLALVNKFNANNDGIDTASAIKIIKQFKNKPINIEHIKQYIVGHIINASFSDKQPDFQENDPIDFMDRKDPFYITAAGLIYKNVFPELAEMLESASDPESPYYGMFSSSWEITFTDYDVAVGSDLLSECKVYKSDAQDFHLYKGNLKSNGGTGASSNGQVNRLFAGKQNPIGCALTENPAADVKGIFTLNSLFSEGGKYYKESVGNKIISENQKINVNQSRTSSSDMTDEQFKELLTALKELKTDKPEESQASAIYSKIEDAIKESGSEWKSKVETAEAEATKNKEALEGVKEELSKANADLEGLKQDLEVREKAEVFNARMTSIAEKFELDEDEEKIVSNEIKELALEETAFASYLEKVNVLFKHKTKEAIAAQKELAEASKKDEVEDKEEKEKDGSEELETESESKANISNNNGEAADKKSLVERLKESGLQLETA